MLKFSLLQTLAVALCSAVLLGCHQSPPATGEQSVEASSEPTSSEPIVLDEMPPMTVPMDAPHAHPDEGMHHGELIELGNEDYHAEMLHEGDLLTIYVLDGTATKTIPIESTEVFMNVVHDGKPKQYTLKAQPDDGDPNGKSSRFTVSSADLVAQLDAEGTKAKLVLTINGTSYRGEVVHDHEGHDHAGHNH